MEVNGGKDVDGLENLLSLRIGNFVLIDLDNDHESHRVYFP